MRPGARWVPNPPAVVVGHQSKFQDMHFLLVYTTSEDFLDRRPEFRAEHLTLAWQAVERGELIIGGPLENPTNAHVMLFEAEDPATVEAFAKNDPYVVNGLVTQWDVRPWTTVVGRAAAAPLRPI